MIFLGLKFWPKVIFWGSIKDAGNFLVFLGHEKKQRDYFGLQKKDRLRGSLGYAKKSSDFFG